MAQRPQWPDPQRGNRDHAAGSANAALVKTFKRDNSVENRVVSLVNYTHSTSSEFFANLVRPMCARPVRQGGREAGVLAPTKPVE